MDFGTRLIEERKRMSLNQTEFGKIGGVTKTSQINYESGERKPNVDYLQAISAAGVDVQYILTGIRKEFQQRLDTLKAVTQRVKDLPLQTEGKLALQQLLYGMETGDENLIVNALTMLPPSPPTGDRRTAIGDRRTSIMQELLDGLNQTQQQEILAAIEEKKQLNQMRSQLDQLINQQTRQSA